MCRRYCQPEELLRADLAKLFSRRKATQRGQQKRASYLARYEYYRLLKTKTVFIGGVDCDLSARFKLRVNGGTGPPHIMHI